MNPSLAYCHVVASVLAADGKMDAAERSFLDRIMTQMGLDSEERDQVMHFENADGAEDVVRRMPQEEREKLRDDLLQATLADSEISPLEQDEVERITEILDL